LCGRRGFEEAQACKCLRTQQGWAFAYEGLANLSGGPIRSSQFVLWTLIPIFRIGVDLGPRIQSLKH